MGLTEKWDLSPFQLDFEKNGTYPHFVRDPRKWDLSPFQPVTSARQVTPRRSCVQNPHHGFCHRSVIVPDLVHLIMDWGTSDDCCLSDLDLNGVVNVINLIALILNWG